MVHGVQESHDMEEERVSQVVSGAGQSVAEAAPLPGDDAVQWL